MKFYFYNSYSQSHTGYQLTQIELDQQFLSLSTVKHFAEPEIESSLLNSGAICLIGKSASGKDYFLFRGIKVTDVSGRTWYINFAVEKENKKLRDYIFAALVSNVLLNHKEFLRALSQCFVAQEGELSYQIRSIFLWDYIDTIKVKSPKEIPFFQKNNDYIQKFTTALAGLNSMKTKELLMLIPESTSAYFIKHHVIFRDAAIRFTIPIKPFRMLIAQDSRLLTMISTTDIKQLFQRIISGKREKQQNDSSSGRNQAKGVLSANHKAVQDNTAAYFTYPVDISKDGHETVIGMRMEKCRIARTSFLHPKQLVLPEKPYWIKDKFQNIARRCASGEVAAMEGMVGYFISAKRHPNQDFYKLAEQFWRVRAYLYGSEKQQKYLNIWASAYTNRYMLSLGIDERLRGNASGELLNALGFLFFEPGREYTLSGIDAQGVVEVSSWESCDGPDEDGFGREEYYDWWYLDEHLTLPEGIEYIHSFSHRDKRNNEAKFQELHDQVAAAGKNCWDDCSVY